MSPSQTRAYKHNYGYQNDESADILEIIQKIPTLTKIGAVCLVMGKFFGIMAIPAAFIPALNILVIPLVITWGGLVFLAVALCSVDHFQKKKLEENTVKTNSSSATIEEIPQLRDQLLDYEDKTDNPTIVIPIRID